MTNINFLLTISIQCQEIKFLEINKNHLRENALIFYQILSTYPFKETYRDQFEEFVRGYWDLKVKRVELVRPGFETPACGSVDRCLSTWPQLFKRWIALSTG